MIYTFLLLLRKINDAYHKFELSHLYLSKQDEIGISLVDNSLYDKIGKSIIKLLFKNNPRTRYFAKTSPQNKKLQNFFVNNGFTDHEYTYVIESN